MKWIKVSERLPEPNIKVLAICPEFETLIRFAEYTPTYSSSEWRPESTNGGPWTVTHWMYLPEPPNE